MTSPNSFSALSMALGDDNRIAIILADGSGSVCFWNAGARTLFGYTALEVINQPVDLIIPEGMRAMHWAGFHHAIGSAWRGSSAWTAIDALHKDGSCAPLEVFLTPLHNADDQVCSVLALFRERS